jgi:hypothetical protein
MLVNTLLILAFFFLKKWTCTTKIVSSIRCRRVKVSNGEVRTDHHCYLLCFSHSEARSKSMATEEPLLSGMAAGSKHGGGEEESLVWAEVKRQLHLAGPLVPGYLLQYVVQLMSLMFVGHLGELELAGASVATSFATVTGFSLLVRKRALHRITMLETEHV